MRTSYPPSSSESETRTRILKSALRLFSRQGYDGTTTRDLAEAANVAEGTLFRHFPTKKAILIEVATQGWVEILTDLLTELSGMENYKAVAQVMRRRMLHLHENADMLRVCFMEAQFHPDLRDHIQTQSTVMAPGAAATEMHSMAEGLADIFLHGVLVHPEA